MIGLTATPFGICFCSKETGRSFSARIAFHFAHNYFGRTKNSTYDLLVHLSSFLLVAAFVQFTSTWSMRRVLCWWASGRDTNRAGGTALLVSMSDWLRISKLYQLLVQNLRINSGRPVFHLSDGRRILRETHHGI